MTLGWRQIALVLAAFLLAFGVLLMSGVAPATVVVEFLQGRAYISGF